MSRQDLVDQVRAQVDALGPASSELQGEVREELFRAVVAHIPDDVPATLPADQAGALAFSVLRAATDLAAAGDRADADQRRLADVREAELEQVRSELADRRRARPDVRDMTAGELVAALLRRATWRRTAAARA